MSQRLFSALLIGAAIAIASPLAVAQDKDKAAKEKREKDLAKVKEKLEKDLRAKKIDPAPALSFITTLVENGEVDVTAAKALLDKVMTKKIPWDEANKQIDKVIAENPKDPKKVVKDLNTWADKWKPKPPEPSPSPSGSPKPSPSPSAAPSPSPSPAPPASPSPSPQPSGK